MGKLSTLELRVDPSATATSETYTPIIKLLKCTAMYYNAKVFKEDYTLKKNRI